MYKEVDAMGQQCYCVYENENYEIALCSYHKAENGGLQRMYLWKVTIINEDSDVELSEVYVLASNRDAAIGQATCGIEVAHECYHAAAQRVENFQIRGWSANNFNANH